MLVVMWPNALRLCRGLSSHELSGITGEGDGDCEFDSMVRWFPDLGISSQLYEVACCNFGEILNVLESAGLKKNVRALLLLAQTQMKVKLATIECDVQFAVMIDDNRKLI